jgi:hypothetical protein
MQQPVFAFSNVGEVSSVGSSQRFVRVVDEVQSEEYFRAFALSTSLGDLQP